MYFEKELKKGYNGYLDCETNDADTQMSVGLLVLEAGDSYTYEKDNEEAAVLLLEGTVQFSYNDRKIEAERPDCFDYEAYCLLAPRKTKITLSAKTHAELYVQSTLNDRDFEAIMFTPDKVQTQRAGSKGELMGCMRRDIKTFFDYDNAPYSNMVLGEVLSYPGKWSSYPPHHHPQPEVYFYRFDKPKGFGAGFSNGEIFETHHNGLAVINHGFHSQVTAPGFAECYMWGIRHLDGDPWRKTRIDDKGFEWLWKEDANDHIFKGNE